MTQLYSINTIDGITIVRFSKQPGADDIRNSIDDVAENYPNNLRLWDFSNGGLNLTSDELRMISEHVKSKFLLSSKIAIVASEDLAFGLSREFEVYREQEQSETRIFRTEQKAMEWLKSQR